MKYMIKLADLKKFINCEKNLEFEEIFKNSENTK